MNSSKAVIEAMTNAPVTDQGPNVDPELTYFILRDGALGKQFVPAEETTPILPGDVLRVDNRTLPPRP